MFDLVNIVKYLSVISYLGFFISSIIGFISINHSFNLTIMMISLIAFVTSICMTYFEITCKLKSLVNINHYYFKAIYQIIISCLVISISEVGIGFGVYGMIIGFINIFMALFDNDNSTYCNYNDADSNTSRESNSDSVSENNITFENSLEQNID